MSMHMRMHMHMHMHISVHRVSAPGGGHQSRCRCIYSPRAQPCPKVREKLCMLQLPYRHVPRPAAAPLPHLEDPNTGWASFGAPQARPP